MLIAGKELKRILSVRKRSQGEAHRYPDFLVMNKHLNRGFRCASPNLQDSTKSLKSFI